MLTLPQIMPYLAVDGNNQPPQQLRHGFYNKSIEHRDRLKEVFGTEYPKYLNINRPREKEEHKAYRKEIYKNTFLGFKTRVIKALDFIQQADDFDVSFPEQKKDADSLEAFTTSDTFSIDGGLQQWFFENVRPKYIDDPNAVLCVLPLSQPLNETARVAPRAMLIDCDKVYAHKKGKFAVLQVPGKTLLTTDTGKPTGIILLFVDQDSYCVARQISRQTGAENKVELNWSITGLGFENLLDGEGNPLTDEDGRPVIVQTFSPPLHGCPVMPVAKIGKELRESNDEDEEFYVSLLNDALPFIELAQAHQNDIQIETNFHVSSQEWRYSTKRCPDAGLDGDQRCVSGVKMVRDQESGFVIGPVKCTTCKGTGLEITGSGTDFILVSPPGKDGFTDTQSTPLPTPPGGFIPRPIEALQELVKEYQRVTEAAYQEINMHFLMKTPYDESGVSKRYDREEMYRELNTQGAHLCMLLQLGFRFAGWQRYGVKAAADQIPTVLAPIRFNLENGELTREELVEAAKEGLDTNLRAPLEKRLIEYQAGKSSDYYRKYELREMCNPYPGKTFEELMFLAASARTLIDPNSPEMQTTMERIWFSVHFDGLLNDLIRTSPSFWDLSLKDQYTKLVEENKKLVGKLAPRMLNPDGTPVKGNVTLAPPADLTNLNQTR